MRYRTIEEFLNDRVALREYTQSANNYPDKVNGNLIAKADVRHFGTTNLVCKFDKPKHYIDSEKYPFYVTKRAVSNYSRIWFLSDADANAFDEKVYNTTYPNTHSSTNVTAVRIDVDGPVPCYANESYIQEWISSIENTTLKDINPDYIKLLKTRMQASATYISTATYADDDVDMRAESVKALDSFDIKMKGLFKKYLNIDYIDALGTVNVKSVTLALPQAFNLIDPETEALDGIEIRNALNDYVSLMDTNNNLDYSKQNIETYVKNLLINMNKSTFVDPGIGYITSTKHSSMSQINYQSGWTIQFKDIPNTYFSFRIHKLSKNHSLAEISINLIFPLDLENKKDLRIPLSKVTEITENYYRLYEQVLSKFPLELLKQRIKDISIIIKQQAHTKNIDNIRKSIADTEYMELSLSDLR